MRTENWPRQNYDCQNPARGLGGIVETAFQAHRNRRCAADQAELEQTPAAKKSGGRGARSRLELRHRPASDDGVLPARNCQAKLRWMRGCRDARRRNSASSRGRPSALQSFLDIGTGSGILAIAAAKLGYQPVHALDFDADAVRDCPRERPREPRRRQNPIFGAATLRDCRFARRENTI